MCCKVYLLLANSVGYLRTRLTIWVSCITGNLTIPVTLVAIDGKKLSFSNALILLGKQQC